MRFSHMLLPTYKEDPADAQVISHKLMLRGGYISKVAAGIYTYLPLGLRVIQKVSHIVREEMNAAYAQEVLMPMVQPKELWVESGRWGQYGAELLRLKDRKDADFCLGPTHEEVITALVRDHVKSYRHLPLNLYQIQAKFRDEVRPRFGLMRGREFIMKDAYSFDVTVDAAQEAYDKMLNAYKRIFKRCGLQFAVVEADTGAIGGNRSNEFQVLADTGEDRIVICESCGYSANVELAAIHTNQSHPSAVHASKECIAVETPSKKTIDELAAFLNIPAEHCLKAVMMMVDGTPVMALCRGDHQVNEIKLRKALQANSVRMMAEEEIAMAIGPAGFVGPKGAHSHLRVVADNGLKGAKGCVSGANEVDKHFVGIEVGRDFEPEFLDIREASDADPCGKCGSPFKLSKGIEVGHVFYLGTKYSKALHATVLDEQGVEQVIEMGCYGIGIGRTAAAAIEQNHDERGIIWPMAIAPFHVELVRIGDDPESIAAADDLYAKLQHLGVEVLYDDRKERPGVKFADADLIGCPIRLNVGGRSLKEGMVEVLKRAQIVQGPQKVALADVVKDVHQIVQESM